jgi:hypothetical protein
VLLLLLVLLPGAGQPSPLLLLEGCAAVGLQASTRQVAAFSRQVCLPTQPGLAAAARTQQQLLARPCWCLPLLLALPLLLLVVVVSIPLLLHIAQPLAW